MHRLLLLLPLLACDAGGKDCTLIGCASQLILTVVGPGDTGTVSGSITVGDRTLPVDCGAGAGDVVCDGDTLVVMLLDGEGGGDVTWSLSADGVDPDDSGGGGGGYAGEGTVTPAWTSSTPNGPDCGPTCWSGTASVELLGTP